MTPQEKASNLYHSFLKIIDSDAGIIPKKSSHLKSKQCAKECAINVIKALKSIKDEHGFHTVHKNEIDYLLQVLKEIEKL